MLGGLYPARRLARAPPRRSEMSSAARRNRRGVAVARWAVARIACSPPRGRPGSTRWRPALKVWIRAVKSDSRWSRRLGAGRARTRAPRCRASPPSRGPRPASRVPDRVVVLHRPLSGGSTAAGSASSSRSSAAAYPRARADGPPGPRTSSTWRTSPSPTSRSEPLPAGRALAAAPPASRGAGRAVPCLGRGLGARARSRRRARAPARRRAEDLGIDLELDATRPPVFPGDRGLAEKGPSPATRRTTTRSRGCGSRHRHAGGERPEGEGAWIDREWSSNALGSGPVGWDWFACSSTTAASSCSTGSGGPTDRRARGAAGSSSTRTDARPPLGAQDVVSSDAARGPARGPASAIPRGGGSAGRLPISRWI